MARVALISLALAVCAAGSGSASGSAQACAPTRADALGPFYKPGAPVRGRVGTGYVLRGRVLAARSCNPIPRARIEFWLVNGRGTYDDDHRATLFASNPNAGYRFQSNRPVAYEGRPPHIHIRVSARGFRTLVTQHYPRGSRTSATFNLVLTRR